MAVILCVEQLFVARDYFARILHNLRTAGGGRALNYCSSLAVSGERRRSGTEEGEEEDEQLVRLLGGGGVPGDGLTRLELSPEVVLMTAWCG